MPLASQEFILFDECKYKLRMFRPEDRDMVEYWINPDTSPTGDVDDLTIEMAMEWSDAELIAGFSGRFGLIVHDIDLSTDIQMHFFDFSPNLCMRRFGMARNPQCRASPKHRMGTPNYIPSIMIPESFWMVGANSIEFNPYADTVLLSLPTMIWMFHHSPIASSLDVILTNYIKGPSHPNPAFGQGTGVSGPNDVWSNDELGKKRFFQASPDQGTDAITKSTVPSRYPSQEDFPFMYKGYVWPENKTVSYQEFFKETTTESFYPMTYPQLLQKYA